MAADGAVPTSGPMDPAVLMAAVQEEITSLNNRSIIHLTGVSGTNTITANASPEIPGYATSRTFVLVPGATNTGDVTLNIDSRGAKSVLGNTGVQLKPGELRANVPYTLTYNGTAFRVVGVGDATARSGIDNSLTIIGVTNVDSVGTLSFAFRKDERTVSCWGRFACNATAGATLTTVELAMPFLPSSDLSSVLVGQVWGRDGGMQVGNRINGAYYTPGNEPPGMSGGGGDLMTAQITFLSESAGSNVYHFDLKYRLF